MQAAGENIEESLKVLLDAGADARLKDHKEQTALMIAQKQGHTEIVKLLKQSEAKTSADIDAPLNILDDDDSYFYHLKEELEGKLNAHPDSPLTDDVIARLVNAAKKQRPLSPSEISHKLMLTLQEAATLSGLPRQHLLEAMEKGRLKAQRLEHAWRIRRVDLDEYIRRLS
jgi:excisionase family DNA binding protein